MPVVRDNARIFTTENRHQDLAALLEFAKGSTVESGFGYLDATGVVDTSRPVELWITCRMTHVFSLATLLGVDGAEQLAAHGVNALRTHFQDPQYGGWYAAISHVEPGQIASAVDDRKAAYAHAFVILAASSARIAQIPQAEELLRDALENQDERWWEADHCKVRESYDRPFTETESYRGVNANMHTTEAYLAAYDATGDSKWLERALQILRWVIDGQARANQWRIPEHFDANWQPLPDYNIDKPTDPFRPYGYTPGHGLEWARLALHAGGQLRDAGQSIPGWIIEGATNLFEVAVCDGWDCDGNPGFVYTTDTEGKPVAHERMHWVLCEALGAATVLAEAWKQWGNEVDPRPIIPGVDSDAAAELPAGELINAYLKNLVRRCDQWWDYATTFLIDQPGQWYHELDRANRVSAVTWPGKPDAYHVAQCLLLPDLPIAPTFALALRSAELRLT